MPSELERRLSTGNPRRQAKRRVGSAVRWMHLSVAEVQNRTSLQLLAANHLVASQISLVVVQKLLLLRHLLRTGVVGGGNPNHDRIVTAVLNAACVNYRVFTTLVRQWFRLDAFLHDITPVELARSHALTLPRNIRIDSWDDAQCYHYTGFNNAQLHRIFRLYGLLDILALTQLTYIQVPTRQRNQRNVQCNYNFDPEELFLFTHTKCRLGDDNKELCINIFGGCEKRWSYGYPWMLVYLDRRYKDIIQHQGLARYVHQFPEFHAAIERELQRPKVKFDNHGNRTEYPGLAHAPFPLFGLIDCSHDPIRVPLSGPDGDFEGAPRKEHAHITQMAFYSGYKHYHSLKIEAIALANGMMTLYGPISGHGNDTQTTYESGLDDFLRLLQQHQHVLYMALGDGIYNNQFLNCIRSYFRAAGPGVILTWQERLVNLELQWIRQQIEFFFAEVSNKFRICASKESYMLAKANPYAVEQLRVCHLFCNIYTCLNGDKLSSKLDVSPPLLEDYLRL